MDPRYLLQAVSGRVVQASFDLPLGMRLVAGRAADAPIRLAAGDTTASRYHALFEASAEGVTVVDLDSRNGIRVNDVPERAAILQAGDRVRIGDAIFRVVRVEPTGEFATSSETTLREEPTLPTRASVMPGARPSMRPDLTSLAPPPPPYVCEVCGAQGPVPALDHEPWWRDVAWICKRCAEGRRTDRASWPENAPDRLGELELLRYLARGATAFVFEARHVRAGCRAAVKLMLPVRRAHAQRGGAMGADAMAMRRFLKEQRLASELVHPAIARCFEVGTAPDGRPWVATELLARGDVEPLAGAHSDLRTVCAVAADLFEALAYAHARGIVHRDVKPGNLLLSKPNPDGTPRAKLTDFGLAKQWRAMGSIVTKEEEVGGSAAFVAPEQLLQFRDVGPSADVYSAGATLYFLLTGDLPVVLDRRWHEATDPQLCLATLADERVPVRDRRTLHPWLADWVDLLVARDPARRAHVQASEVASMLRQVPG